MNNIFYSVGDKGIYDGILQGTITKDHLEEIFLSRGIIISHKTDRQTLARYFSRFPHSYEDFERLSNILGSSSQREKLTHFNVTSSIDFNQFDEIIESFKENLEQYGDINCSYRQSSDNCYKININYKVHNFNKSEFRQVTNKDAVIEIHKSSDNKFLIRHPNNSNVKDFIHDFTAKIQEISDDSFEIKKINLENISNVKLKTKFIVYLIENIYKFDLHDVIDAYVYNPKSTKETLDSDEDFDEDLFNSDVSVNTGVHISKASLKGIGILKSEEIDQLYNKGFYLYRVVWQSKVSNLPDSDIYEFEVTFDNPENMTDFSYIIKGIYKYKNHGLYSKSKSQPNKQDSNWLNELIEKSAEESINNIKRLISNENK